MEIPSLEYLISEVDHPNPNINKKAFLDLVEYWPEEGMKTLMNNLNSKDITLRRKSIIGLGFFGESVLIPLSKIFVSSEDRILKTSILKVFVKVASSHDFISIPTNLQEVIDLALRDETPEVTLIVVMLLRQLGLIGLPILLQISRGKNVLRSSAAITALSETNDPSVRDCLQSIINCKDTDQFILAKAKESLEIYIDRFLK